MDDEEWDLAAIDELERIAQEAIAAKRASQMPPPLVLSSGSSFVDAWDAGALGMDLQHSSQLQNGHERVGSPKKRSQKEIDRLATELAFKDQEVLDAKRACLEKDEQLKKAMASCSALQKEVEALKGGINQTQVTKVRQDAAFDPVSVLKARISSSPGCATATPVSSAPQAQQTYFRQSIMPEPEVSCRLQHVWGPVNQEAAGNDVLRYILATCGTELHALQSLERSNEVVGSCNSTGFSKTLSSVSCGSSRPLSLVDPLMKFLHLEDGTIIRSSLHVLRTLLQVDYVSRQATLLEQTTAQISSSADKVQVQAEVKGCGWSFHPKNLQSPGGGPRLMFCSPRLICKPKEAGDATNFHGDVHGGLMEEPRELIRTLLRLSANASDPALRYEALSIIMLLLLEADPLVGRLWIGSLLLEGGISCLLHRSAGSDIQLCVVKLAHLLFNCPDLLSRLCTTNGDGDALVRAGQELFEALRGCLTQKGNSSEDCVLRKYALQALALVVQAGNDGVAALVYKIGASCSKSVSNISVELISLLELLLNEEENQGRFDKMDGLSDERLCLMQETLSILSKLLLDPVHGMAIVGFLTTDGETSRRSLDVTNRLVRLGSSRPGRKGDFLNLGKGLRSKILECLSRRSDPLSKSDVLSH